MKKEEAKQFIESNKEALIDLAELVRHAELGAINGKEFEIKREARLIVEKWISEIFNIAYAVDDMQIKEESIYRRLDRERQEGRADAY